MIKGSHKHLPAPWKLILRTPSYGLTRQGNMHIWSWPIWVSLELWSFSNQEVRQGFNKLSNDFCVNFVRLHDFPHTYKTNNYNILTHNKNKKKPSPLCLAFQYHGQLTMLAQIADGVSQKSISNMGENLHFQSALLLIKILVITKLNTIHVHM